MTARRLDYDPERDKYDYDARNGDADDDEHRVSFWSHKFKHDGLRYVICLHMFKPIIVHASGGYPAGTYNDLTVARLRVVPAMLPNERGNADGGYQEGFRHFLTPIQQHNAWVRDYVRGDVVDEYNAAHKAVQGRHEHINAELKEFGVMAQQFRHHPAYHLRCFDAVVQLLQLRLELNPTILNVPKKIAVLDQGEFRILTLNANE